MVLLAKFLVFQSNRNDFIELGVFAEVVNRGEVVSDRSEMFTMVAAEELLPSVHHYLSLPSLLRFVPVNTLEPRRAVLLFPGVCGLLLACSQSQVVPRVVQRIVVLVVRRTLANQSRTAENNLVHANYFPITAVPLPTEGIETASHIQGIPLVLVQRVIVLVINESD
jgi:hypothetical protein